MEVDARNVTTLTSGSSWTVPPGVSSVTAQCIGAGGNGGAGSSTSHGGGGGAGGDYAQLATLSVTAGNTIMLSTRCCRWHAHHHRRDLVELHEPIVYGRHLLCRKRRRQRDYKLGRRGKHHDHRCRIAEICRWRGRYCG